MATKRKKQEEELVVMGTQVEEVEELEDQEELGEEAEEEEEFNDLMFDEEGNELLFPGGPTLGKVEEWKSLHGDIYLTEFDQEVFVWRTLKRKEYKEIMKVQGADNFYKEERICDKVMLYPENYNFMEMGRGKAGIPTLVSELVMEKSGFQAKTGAMKL